MSSGKSKRHLNQTWYVILFIFALSLFSSVFLSTIYYILAPFQERAVVFDRDQQMLTAARVLDFSGKFQIYENDAWHPATYDKKSHLLKITEKAPVVTGSVLDSYTQGFVRPLLANRRGEMFSFKEKNLNVAEFIEKHQNGHFYQQPLLLFYVILENTEKARAMSDAEVIKNPSVIRAIIIPISGFGLWGPIYGYLAVENNGDTVLGTAWYQQAETPGLGANIANPHWQKQFYGKKIFLEAASGTTDFATTPLGLEVIKGSVQSVFGTSPKARSSIDGISGATLTCNGVTEAYALSLAPYRNLLISFAQLNNQRDRNGRQ
ncbi:Na (+)-translocating NADH-quinone reductase subunit C [Chlamydia felis Fe/C-56]|uniref:Na(+)-translocating NADH-quinone reductase subunit C n=1 Tax=Chlamydia felis (strain Fe/C-56) TaxID=264202 RepID=Q253X3_CHLFF|nr:Na(+)-translocating NADH-quinone reductase subunit C [Chlamydia felis]BAE81415.1 Na (+)-translocating NADH-quinone reductase subunit C [Chlamydia felis Fe/C-56]